MKDYLGSMTPADRQRWLALTERQLSKTHARLARDRQNVGAQLELEALTARKAMLMRNYNPAVSGEAMRFNARSLPTRATAENEALLFWERELYSDSTDREEEALRFWQAQKA